MNERAGPPRPLSAAAPPIAANKDRALRRWSPWLALRGALGFLVSLLVHLALLIGLALIIAGDDSRDDRVSLVVSTDDAEPALDPVTWTAPDELLEEAALVDAPVLTEAVDPPAPPTIHAPFSQPVSAGAVTQPSEQARLLPSQDLLLMSAAPSGGGFEGRSAARRAELAARFGGTAASEQAVEAGLQWLAAHQRPDGSWRLKHTFGDCDCANEGYRETSIGATGLALLPFLGAGYTHLQGPYHEVVRGGLDYLVERMVETPTGGSLVEGANFGMYTHGIATVALCEAYAMTRDQRLQPAAEQAVRFIVAAQHPRGGWRYNPGQPGDTTVTGWQVMALKSARMAGLWAPDAPFERAGEYLDSVATPEGCFYGYQTPKREAGPTAVGLLLRMYLGWSQNDPRLDRGALYLATVGPSETDVYFNYYATQVLHHHGGNGWPRWNARMRDSLVETQERTGHEKGSWFFPDRHGTIGGRLYTTAMCVMILEVYYRHMPLYGDAAVGDGLF